MLVVCLQKSLCVCVSLGFSHVSRAAVFGALRGHDCSWSQIHEHECMTHGSCMCCMHVLEPCMFKTVTDTVPTCRPTHL